MSAYPSLPLFTDAYIADTAHLTNEEHGAYLRLLMFAWRSPKCCLPDDDARLARMLGLTPKKWAGLKPNVMAFWTLENGAWVQSRLSRERQFVEEKVEKRRAAGKQGGRPKSLENNETAKANGYFSESKPKAPTPTLTPNTSSLRSDVCETPNGATRQKGTILPDDWAAKDRHLAKAAARGFPAAFVQDQADRMRNWALSNSNRAVARKADWDRTFDNWLGEAMDKAANRRPPPQQPRKSAQATFLDIAREAHETLTRSEPHDRPFDSLDGEILPAGSPQPTTRRAHLSVYERPGSEAWDRDQEGYPGRVRAFG